MKTRSTYIIIPNLNGKSDLLGCVESLLKQTLKGFEIVIVENGSTDGSVDFVKDLDKKHSNITGLYNKTNLGFAGGVNTGIRYALQNNADYILLFNNDAIADKSWVKNLVDYMTHNPGVGIATCKLLHDDGKTIDSTGEGYSIWGLPYPRGRNEKTINKYDEQTDIFAASGGASIYRAKMLNQIGLFDEDFFAYYEDVDISFRAQLAGWKVSYVPKAIAYHQQGATSSKIKGFTVYQTMKNLPLLMTKNIPKELLSKVLPKFIIAYLAFFISAILKGNFAYALRGWFGFLGLLPKKLNERKQIQSNVKVGVNYIDSRLMQDLPPDQIKLRRLIGKK